MKTTPTRVEKPWGHETIWASTDLYVGKVLHVEAGESLSLQYHEVKTETLHVLTGSVRLEVGASVDDLESVVLGPGEGFHLPAGTIHRLDALETADVLEASTPHLDDLVRLEDRYGRGRDDRS
ncbi:MAG TPA: cupin domain-containing protein [Longimicrobiales bacterium]|nr:cupin domain-containing protein [Longimicrobiales bacterium]